MNDFVFDAANVAVHQDPEHLLLVKGGTSLRKRINLMCRSSPSGEILGAHPPPVPGIGRAVPSTRLRYHSSADVSR